MDIANSNTSSNISRLYGTEGPFCLDRRVVLVYMQAKQVVRVWRHEITRVILDRLINEDDQALVNGHLVTLLSAHYQNKMDYVMRDPILYGDYRNTLDPAEPRLYEAIEDFPTAQVCTSTHA